MQQYDSLKLIKIVYLSLHKMFYVLLVEYYGNNDCTGEGSLWLETEIDFVGKYEINGFTMKKREHFKNSTCH